LRLFADEERVLLSPEGQNVIVADCAEKRLAELVVQKELS